MRAKEYIAHNEKQLKYADEIKQIVAAAMPLRHSQQLTVDFYNQYLTADIRMQTYLLKKDLYEKHNAMQPEPPEPFQMNEGEIPVEIIADVRDELFDVLKGDETFGYLYFLLVNLRNSQHPSNPDDFWPDDNDISSALQNQRDDYPKLSLAEFLDDEINFRQYQDLADAGITDESTLLSWFNNTYRLYDEMRLHKANPITAAKVFLDDDSYGSKTAKDMAGRFICEIIMMTSQDDKRLDRVGEELNRHLPEESSLSRKNTSRFFLSQKKGRKTNFARVINVLLEMNYIVDSDGAKATKQDFFNALGKLLNENFADYQNLLSTTKGASASDQKALVKIFEDMLDKQQEIISK